MLSGIAEIIVRSNVARENSGRKKQFLPWQQIQTIALILSSADNINKSAVDKFVDGTGKLISVFYIESASKTPTYADWQCLSKKERSFLGLPNKSVLEELKAKKFDLVVNTSGEGDLFSVALTSAMQATLKCGNGKKFNETDLIIQKAEPYHVIDYLNEVVRYLKMIRA